MLLHHLTPAIAVSGNVVIPAAIANAGERAVRRFLAAIIRNRNTREARA
jgi:hypothetical protein